MPQRDLSVEMAEMVRNYSPRSLLVQLSVALRLEHVGGTTARLIDEIDVAYPHVTADVEGAMSARAKLKPRSTT